MNPVESGKKDESGCQAKDHSCACREGSAILEKVPEKANKSEEIVCCGKQSEPGNPFEKPGYEILPFVEEFIQTPAGYVPRIKTSLRLQDEWEALVVRFGRGRFRYRVAPGLYCAGKPDAGSPVLVTANYKLTFDKLRKDTDGLNAWIQVLETQGINVWCAAGKKTFSTNEVVFRVNDSGLEKLVNHRKLVLPQLSATGVSARDVKKQSGFEVIWGPVRSEDIQAFLKNGNKADPKMRTVTFDFRERMSVVPVEITAVFRHLLWMIPALIVISGIGSHIFSFSGAWNRGHIAVYACLAGVFAGTVLTPAFLFRIPGTAFSIKGAITGLLCGLAPVFFARGRISLFEALLLLIFSATIGSFLAMNFTGATPYTSPSGVEKEMRKSIPFQIAGILLFAILWIGAGFTR